MTPISRKPTECSRPKLDVDTRYGPRRSTPTVGRGRGIAFQTLFPLITVVLCFLHGFLKIR